MRIAVLDIDGTMLSGSVGLSLLRELRLRGLGTPSMIDSVFSTLDRYRRGEIDYRAMVDETTVAYGAAIRGLETTTVSALAGEVWGECRPRLFAFVRPMVARLQRWGLRPVIISSSPIEIVACLAAELAVNDAVGSRFAVEGGTYTGACALMPGSDGGKLRALRWALDRDGSRGGELAELIDRGGSLALGNALSDACVLELVGHPIVFEPSSELREVASAHGWPISDRERVLDDMDRLLGPGCAAR